MDRVRHLTLLTLEQNFYLKTIHIEGKKNEIADSVSPFQMERFWSLVPQAEQTPCPVPSTLLEIWTMTSAITWAFPLQHQPSKLIPQLKKDFSSFAFSINLLLASLWQWMKTLLISMLPTWHNQSIKDSSIKSYPTAVHHLHMIWILKNMPALNIATCGVTNATGFGLLVTNFSRVVASLATTISSYYYIYFFIS